MNARAWIGLFITALSTAVGISVGLMQDPVLTLAGIAIVFCGYLAGLYIAFSGEE